MKYIITILSLFYGLNCLAQTPNPDLFQTWYLYDYYSTDDNIHHPVSTVIPAVSPYITFDQNLTHSGVGACNGFTGAMSFPADDFIIFDNFGATLTLCGYQSHTNLEGAFFSLLYNTGGQYIITGSGNTMGLKISTPIFMEYVFGKVPLGTSKFDLNQITIYPNPVDSKFAIASQNNGIDKIEIVNSLGQMIKTVDAGFEAVDVSDFASGVYLVKLYSEGKIVTKKIVKK